MIVGTKKYNPGFLSDDEIVSSFCVRNAEFESLLESLDASVGTSNVHSLVVGPRGSGKTHLLLRVAAEIRRNSRFSEFHPIVFAEESYEIATIGEFWLESLNHLAEQATESERSSLRLTYSDLSTRGDDRELEGRCLGTLLDYAERHTKRLLLLVENLDMLFADIGDPDAGWRLRHMLQTEPRIVLFGSAISRFEEIDHPDHALYDLFKVVTLQALDTDDCDTLWSSLTGQPKASQPIRPLQILTGGNLRLISVVAGFEKTYSFNVLMSNLLDLVDEHTEYFKSHIEALPPQERRVYLALARLWKPATANEVAAQARVNVNKCSVQLRRLVDRGAASMDDGTKRRRTYFVAERMYNIYYLLRRPGAESHMVQALVRFMGSYYSPDEMVHIGIRMAEGLDRNDPRLMQIQSTAFRHLLALPELGNQLVELLTQDAVIGAFGSARSPDIVEPIAKALIVKAKTLEGQDRFEEALGCWDDVIRVTADGGDDNLAVARGVATMSKIGLLKKLDRHDEAIETTASSFLARDLRVDVSMADAISKIVLGVDDISAHPVGIAFRALTLLIHGNIEAAIEEADAALKLLAHRAEVSDRQLRGLLIVVKGLLVATQGRTIEKTHVEKLLADIGEQSLIVLPRHILHVLLRYFATIEPTEALALIENGRVAEPLQPIVVALRRELGENLSVAPELDEVSKDVQGAISQLRKELDSGPD